MIALLGAATGLGWWGSGTRPLSALWDGKAGTAGAGMEHTDEAGWSQVRESIASPRRAGSDRFEVGSEALPGPPGIYVAAIDLLGRGEGLAALEAFDRISADEIPVDLAYAPYRLHSALRPAVRSPHADRLLEAALENELPDLLGARVLAHEGRLTESLGVYRATDPARWTRYDLNCLEMLADHGALKPDLDSMIWRAIARRGADDPLEEELRALVEGEGTDWMERRLRSRLERDPQAREIALRSLRRMQGARRLFLERRYEDLLEGFGDSPPSRITTEMSTILFLAAVAQGESHYAYRWGQELKRRHPDRELARWVADLTANVRGER